MVKPVDGDNFLGVALVGDHREFDVALAAAFARSDEALVESFVPLGREVRCGILVHDGELLCLALKEYNVERDARPIRRHEGLDRGPRRSDPSGEPWFRQAGLYCSFARKSVLCMMAQAGGRPGRARGPDRVREARRQGATAGPSQRCG